MPTYIIGDIQGCWNPLQALLKKVQFNPDQDRLWLVGDLVNRGPQSLEILRWARGLGDRLTLVLGNHDLHFIGRALGVSKAKKADTLDEILAAPELGEMVEWLLQRPLIHREGDALLVHAGLLPEWSLEEIESLAEETAVILRGPQGKDLIASLSGKDPVTWDANLKGLERYRVFLKILTRIRICDEGGRADFHFTGTLKEVPQPYRAWFDHSHKRTEKLTTYFGHWSALGLHCGPGVVGLDTGCVWGRQLTAYRLEDGQTFQVGAT